MIPRHKRQPLLTEAERRRESMCHRCLAYIIVMSLIGFAIGLSVASDIGGCGLVSWIRGGP